MTGEEFDACFGMIVAANRVLGFLEGSKIGEKVPMGYLTDLEKATEALTKVTVLKGEK